MASQTCNNPDCQIAKNGSCLQGHDPIPSCPNFGKALSEEELTQEINLSAKLETEPEPAPDMVQLPSGQPFTQSDVDSFQLRNEARLVAIVGDTSSGKTTLLCSIYDQFSRRRFADRAFIGSATLMAFEQIAHHSRDMSGATAPNTQRTSWSEGLRFYHLATVQAGQQDSRADLFLSDRAGEAYRAAMDRPNELLILQELRLARVVAVLVDGARLVCAEEQHEVLDAAHQLVRTMMDSGTLGLTQHLQIILTKRDEVERSGNAEQYVARVQAMVDGLAENFEDQLASICFFEISARDPQDNYEQAFGCDVLLQSWIDADVPQLRSINPSIQLQTPFDRLAVNLVYGTAS